MLACSQQNSNLTLVKNEIKFGMVVGGGNEKHRADRCGICFKTRNGKFRISVYKPSFAHILD